MEILLEVAAAATADFALEGSFLKPAATQQHQGLDPGVLQRGGQRRFCAPADASQQETLGAKLAFQVVHHRPRVAHA